MKTDDGTSEDLRFAEWVLPGHPDRLADAVADAIVDAACQRDPDAQVGVEVAVHRDVAFVDGRVAGEGAGKIDVDALVRGVYARAGYGCWTPNPTELRVLSDLCLGPLSDAERKVRGVAEDQSVVVGYACGDERTNFLPAEHYLARTLAQRIDSARRQSAGPIGPDGKVLVTLSGPQESPRLRSVSVSLHHCEDADDVAVARFAREAVEAWLEDASRAFPTLAGVDLGPDVLRINGAGSFAVGGPFGDNGLSGKKLAVDFYGPSVPIGGGALCGKDPHKVDRSGALRARQIAKHLVVSGVAADARVHLAYMPGTTAPAHVAIVADGRPLDGPSARRWLSGYDLTLNGTHRDLGLIFVLFQPLAVWGPWSDPYAPWELWAPGMVSTASSTSSSRSCVQDSHVIPGFPK